MKNSLNNLPLARKSMQEWLDAYPQERSGAVGRNITPDVLRKMDREIDALLERESPEAAAPLEDQEALWGEIYRLRKSLVEIKKAAMKMSPMMYRQSVHYKLADEALAEINSLSRK